MKKLILLYSVLLLLILSGNTIGEGSKVIREVTGGKAYVKSDDGDILPGEKYVTTVHVTIDFKDPAAAYGGRVIVEKGGKSVEVTTMPEGQYARGKTNFFQGRNPLGLWKAYLKRIPKQGVKIYLRIEYSSSVQIAPQPKPVIIQPEPKPRYKPPPELDSGDIKITSEIQFQALTRILIRKGIIKHEELADEIQRVASGI